VSAGFIDDLRTWLEIISVVVAGLGAIVSAWSYVRTRKRYFDEYRRRRDR